MHRVKALSLGEAEVNLLESADFEALGLESREDRADFLLRDGVGLDEGKCSL